MNILPIRPKPLIPIFIATVDSSRGQIARAPARNARTLNKYGSNFQGRCIRQFYAGSVARITMRHDAYFLDEASRGARQLLVLRAPMPL
jgi:hypothetical protein